MTPYSIRAFFGSSLGLVALSGVLFTAWLAAHKVNAWQKRVVRQYLDADTANAPNPAAANAPAVAVANAVPA